MIASESQILFDKFEIIEVLKKDDQSAVYLANHIYLGKKIILKILDRNRIDDDSIIERFKREAKILASLDHPNIIKVLDFGLYENYFYISFEYFVSDNLRYHIKNDTFSYDQKLDLVKQLFVALHFAHSNNIIHRDIKPENIMVNNDGRLKIADFGLAYSRGDNFVTSKSSVVGTPAYMSPEQIQGDDIDERSDLFSSGIMIYELFSGINLFIADDINQTINNILNFEYEETRETIEKDLPELSTLLTGLINPDRTERFQSASEVLEVLEVDVPIPDLQKEVANQNSKSSSKYIMGSVIILIFFLTAYVVWNLSDKPLKQVEQTEKPFVQDEQPSEPQSEDIPVPDEEKVTDNFSKGQEKLPEKVANEDKSSNPPDENTTLVSEDISYGNLAIHCSPWAYVYIDSVLIDSTPLKEDVQLESGIHLIELRNPSYPDYSREIAINPDETNSLEFNLDSLFSFLNVKVHPWGEVFIGGKSYGETPFTSPITIEDGKYEIFIKNPELGEFKKEINTVNGDTLEFVFNFRTMKFSLK